MFTRNDSVGNSIWLDMEKELVKNALNHKTAEEDYKLKAMEILSQAAEIFEQSGLTTIAEDIIDALEEASEEEPKREEEEDPQDESKQEETNDKCEKIVPSETDQYDIYVVDQDSPLDAKEMEELKEIINGLL